MATSAPGKSVSDCVALLSAAKDEQRSWTTARHEANADTRRSPAHFRCWPAFVRRLLLTPKGELAQLMRMRRAATIPRARSSVLASFAYDPVLVSRSEFGSCVAASDLSSPTAYSMTADELRDSTAVLGALLRPPDGLAGA